MSSQEFTDNHAPPGTPVRAGSPLGVAMIG